MVPGASGPLSDQATGGTETSNTATVDGGNPVMRPCDTCPARNECRDCCFGQALQKPGLEPFPEYVLPGDQTEAAAAFAGDILKYGAPHSLEEQLAVASVLTGWLKAHVPEFVAGVESLRRTGGPAAVVLRGLPITDARTGELWSLALSLLTGAPFQYLQQPDGGKLVAELTPKPGYETIKNTGQSRQEFVPHTDFSVFAPDASPAWLQLVGVHNDAQAWTSYTPIEPFVPELDERELRKLQTSAFLFQAPTSFSSRVTLVSKPLPILWRDENVWQVSLPTHWVKPADEKDDVAQAALDSIIAKINSGRWTRRMVIGPGEVLIFANHRGLHARGTVDGNRLVLRTYITRNLDALRSRTGNTGHILDGFKLL